MAIGLDIGEISRCTCPHARRATRRLTQIYDRALRPIGLTSNQFGLLVILYGHSLAAGRGLAIGALAERLGMDPTTLNRNLRPLSVRGLVASAASPEDRRVRVVYITRKGLARLRRAVPPWRRTQAGIREALGDKTLVTLNDLLDLTAKITK